MTAPPNCEFEIVSDNGQTALVVCAYCGRRATVPKEHAVTKSVYSHCRVARAESPRPQVDGGPGTELKKILGRIGITATATCSCNARAATMDEREAEEPGWCEANIDMIVGWLRDEATRRGLPFIDAVGKMLVRRAIANARRNA